MFLKWTMDIDWSQKTFTLHNYCSMLIEQLIDLRKVRTENLKIRTDLKDQDMGGWSVTGSGVDDCLQRQIAKKSSNSKLKLFLSMLVTEWLSNKAYVNDSAANSVWL